MNGTFRPGRAPQQQRPLPPNMASETLDVNPSKTIQCKNTESARACNGNFESSNRRPVNRDTRGGLHHHMAEKRASSALSMKKLLTPREEREKGLSCSAGGMRPLLTPRGERGSQKNTTQQTPVTSVRFLAHAVHIISIYQCYSLSF